MNDPSDEIVPFHIKCDVCQQHLSWSTAFSFEPSDDIKQRWKLDINKRYHWECAIEALIDRKIKEYHQEWGTDDQTRS